VNTIPPADLPSVGGGASFGPDQAGVGTSFLFAAWKKTGDGSLTSFERAITINAPYDGQKASATGLPEEYVRLFMYNPAIQAWIPVGGDLDIYHDLISGLVANLSPFVDGPYAGQTLFSAAVIQPLRMEQAVESDGTTSFDFGPILLVPPGTVKPGTHFEFGRLSDLPVTNYVLVGDAYSFGAYFVNRAADAGATDMEIPEFSEPATLVFYVPEHVPDELEQPGESDLTIVTASPETGAWVDVEELGHRVTRIPDLLSVDIDSPGVFAVAIRQPETTAGE
jgi:hypothetical protein